MVASASVPLPHNVASRQQMYFSNSSWQIIYMTLNVLKGVYSSANVNHILDKGEKLLWGQISRAKLHPPHGTQCQKKIWRRLPGHSDKEKAFIGLFKAVPSILTILLPSYVLANWIKHTVEDSYVYINYLCIDKHHTTFLDGNLGFSGRVTVCLWHCVVWKQSPLVWLVSLMS